MAYANDSSGFNNNGTITGAQWWSDSVNGSALWFDGTNDFVDVPANASLNLTNAGTISAWVKPTALNSYGGIVAKGTVGADDMYGLFLRNNVPEVRYGDTGNTILVPGNVLTTNRTYFIMGTWDGATISLYIDGALQNTAAQTFDQTPSMAPLRFGSDEAGNNLLAGILDEVRIYNYALNESERAAVYKQHNPVPSYPMNITIPATYPPQTTTINFTWHDTRYSGDRLQVAKDIAFNQIVVDITTTLDSYSANLDSGQTYYWKVTGTGGGITSSVETFTISGVSTAAGQGIQGVVYEKVNGVTTPIDQATVFIYNSTWSTTQITGSNGYYLFQNLENGSYNLVASKRDYVTSGINLVTLNASNTSMETHDIFLVKCTAPETCNWGSHYVKFIVQNWFGNVKYQYITANVFKGSEASASMSGITGTDGTVSFLLTKDQQYTLSFTNASQGVSESVTITASDTVYYIIVTDTELPWWTNQSYSAVDVVTFSVSTNAVNASFAWVNVSYNDTLGQTTALTFYLNQTNHTGTNNTQAILQTFTASSFSNNSHGFLVPSYQGQSYIVSVKATHTTFGSIYRSFGVHFQGTATTVDDFIPAQLKAILAIGFMLFIGGIFGEVRAAQGALLFCGLGWLFFFMDWFNWFGATIENSIGVGLVLGSVVSIMWLMVDRQRSEEMR